MKTTMHGISVKLSASALTAAAVEGIEWVIDKTTHYTLGTPWTTYLAIGVGFAVGYLIRETAPLTHGEITITNTDKGATPMAEVAAESLTPDPATNAALVDAANPTPDAPTLADNEVVFDGVTYVRAEDGTLTPKAEPVADPNLVTVDGVTYTRGEDGTLTPTAL